MSLKIPYFSREEGLVFCSDPASSLNDSEILHLAEAEKLGASAVFFRRYYQSESDLTPINSEPAVTIFEESQDLTFGNPNHIALHASIWSSGKSEVYVLQSSTTIKIINARKPAEFANNRISLENLVLVSDALEHFEDQRFSSYHFSSGTFWEQEAFLGKTKGDSFFRNRLEEENMPYHQLLTFLKHTRTHLRQVNSGRVEAQIFDKLIIVCLLIKFLEELKSEDGTHTLTQIYEKHRVVNFAEALSTLGKSVDILEELGAKLNGQIFDYFTDRLVSESEEEFVFRNRKIKDILRKIDLSAIADLLMVRLNKKTGELEFEILTKQLKLDFDFSWQQYSFRHLPIELTSSIYEHFLQEDSIATRGNTEKGVVYTPPFLVNFLVDEVMPLSNYRLLNNNHFKVLDPSCGSGIFLVTAYKRILQWWVITYYHQYNKLPSKYDPKIFQELLENNIFGVDVNRKATLITIFSLTIAFLDKLDPIAFWENLSFKTLQNNIRVENFFEWSHSRSDGFDLVIGNPPFNVPDNFKKKEREYLNLMVLPFADQLSVKKHNDIPDISLALRFLEFIISQKNNIKICLVIPATIFLFSPIKMAIKYRTELFERINAKKILDFTHLRRVLFHKAVDIPVVTLIAENRPSDNGAIEHIVLKRMTNSEKKIRFEIDHYDRYLVRHDWAIDPGKQSIWKSNLLGGGRLFHLIYRLSLLSNLADLIARLKSHNSDWLFEVGYQIGTPKVQDAIYYIHGQDKLTHIDKVGNLISNEIEEHKYFYREKKNSSLFQPPMIVIQKKIGNNHLPVGIKETYEKKYFVFNATYIGIHAPEAEIATLRDIYYQFKTNENVYVLWILTNSSSAMIGQETAIQKQELGTLPFPAGKDGALSLSAAEQILCNDVLNYYIHLGKSIADNRDGAILNTIVDNSQLLEFGKVFCSILNPMYANYNMSWQIGNIYRTPSFVIFQFGYGENHGMAVDYIDRLDETIQKLIFGANANNPVKYKRIIRVYDHIDGYDCLFLIKPHATRYWLGSIAIRDADETYLDLKKEGF
jgi:type I restriction-modification system DNA methylase subunit